MEKQSTGSVNLDGPEPAPGLESQTSDALKPASSGGVFARLNERINSIRFLEARGIERVPESERHTLAAADYLQMALLWFSTNITANNIAVGMLGPLDYGLSFVDSALCATFGALLGAAGAAYMGTWGPVSGNRTMVCQLLRLVVLDRPP
jgi:Permease for cytosine/purines, uracil, thiamine, allantoin